MSYRLYCYQCERTTTHDLWKYDGRSFLKCADCGKEYHK